MATDDSESVPDEALSASTLKYERVEAPSMAIVKTEIDGVQWSSDPATMMPSHSFPAASSAPSTEEMPFDPLSILTVATTSGTAHMNCHSNSANINVQSHVTAQKKRQDSRGLRTISRQFKRDLIALVKQFPAIYDTRCRDYNDGKCRPLAWQTVRDRMLAKGYPEAETAMCATRWRTLKAFYLKERLLMKRSTGSYKPYVSRWVLYNDMDFIAPFLNADLDSRACMNYEQSNSGAIMEDILTDSDNDSAGSSQRNKAGKRRSDSELHQRPNNESQKHPSKETQRYPKTQRRPENESLRFCEMQWTHEKESKRRLETQERAESEPQQRPRNDLRVDETLAHVRATSSAVASLCETFQKNKTGVCEFCGRYAVDDRQLMHTLGTLTTQLDSARAETLRRRVLEVACATYAQLSADSRIAASHGQCIVNGSAELGSSNPVTH